MKTEDKKSDFSSNVVARKGRDRVFLVLPLLAIILSVYHLISSMNSIDEDSSPGSSQVVYKYIEISTPILLLATLIFIPAYLGFLVMVRKVILKVYMGSSIFIFVAIIGVSLYVNPLLAIVPGVLLCVTLLVFCCHFRTLKLAALLSENALSSCNGMIFSMSLRILPIAFYAVFSALIFMIASQFQYLKDGYDRDSVITFILAFCLIYSHQLSMAVAYLFGASYYSFLSSAENIPNKNEKFASLNESLSVAYNKSLGTASFGALLITIIRMLKNAAQSMKNDSQQNKDLAGLIIYCLVVFILSMIETLIEYMNSTAYVYAALYGKGLISSGKMGFKSFNNKGLERFLNYVVVDDILNVGAIIFSALVGGGAFFIMAIVVGIFNIKDAFNFNTGSDAERSMIRSVAVIIFIVLAFVTTIVNSMVGGIVNCTLTLYIEDPNRLKKVFRKMEKLEKLIESS